MQPRQHEPADIQLPLQNPSATLHRGATSHLRRLQFCAFLERRGGRPAKGRVNGRGFGRRRTLVAQGRGYGTRMCKATRWEAAEPTLKAATRAHGLATWAVTGRGKLAVQHLQNTATPDGLRPYANGRNPLQATKHTKAENTPLRHFNTPRPIRHSNTPPTLRHSNTPPPPPSFPPQPRHSCVGRNPATQTIPVPLRSSVRGTRTSGARTQGDARGGRVERHHPLSLDS